MQFYASNVSATVAGDYYQVYFGPEESEDDAADSFTVRGPYLLVQRQFEMFDGGRCHIETLDDDYIGEFALRLIEIRPTKLSFEISRKNNNRVQVTFALDASAFEEVRRVVEIIFGLKEPNEDAL